MAEPYQGKFLVVDLSEGKSTILPLSEELKTKFVGGKGFGARLLYDLVPAGADPLGPDNVLMFMPGPLTGTAAPGMRACVVTKSPLTGTFVDSYHGGHFTQEIKYAGYDGLIVRGRAAQPVYLFIDDDRVEIRSAERFWGKDTFAASRGIKEELGDETVKVACIGPAGENLVRFALICCEYNRQAGRGGTGAVMGSKNLKAVAVRGTKPVFVANTEAFLAAAWKGQEEARNSDATKALTVEGTASAILFANDEGLLPHRNFADGQFSDCVKLAHEAQNEEIWLRHVGCASCPVSCSKIGVIRSGPHAGTVSDIVEYETSALMGANLELSNIREVAYLVQQCDALGLDGMSAGGVIGFAIEAFQKGIITTADTDGQELAFGDAKAVGYLVDLIAHRRGRLGWLLGEGVKRAAAELGQGSEAFACHTKGLETPAWGPRSSPGMGLAYATADRGGCHQRGFPLNYETGGEWEGEQVERLGLKHKAAILAYLQNYLAGLDTLVKCDFVAFGITGETYAAMLSAALGVEYSEADLVKLGERVWNMIRLFNWREGFRRRDDSLPPRFMTEPLPNGPCAGHLISESDLNKMLDEYYQIRGWDREGRPLPDKLAELGLENLSPTLVP